MKSKFFKTLQTNDDWVGLIARMAIGIVFFPHGAQKLLGWWGGYGFSGTMTFFTDTLNLPWLVAFMVIIIEFFGVLSLVAGFATRLWSLLTIILCMGIVFSTHWQHGFFMNWFGNQQGEGFEFFILMIGLCVVCLINGGGKYSADSVMARK